LDDRPYLFKLFDKRDVSAMIDNLKLDLRFSYGRRTAGQIQAWLKDFDGEIGFFQLSRELCLTLPGVNEFDRGLLQASRFLEQTCSLRSKQPCECHKENVGNSYFQEGEQSAMEKRIINRALLAILALAGFTSGTQLMSDTRRGWRYHAGFGFAD
jgi:hypothetical protein